MSSEARLLRRLLILGTDTGVGKTVVTALITRALARAGVDAVPFKPVAAGAAAGTDGPYWADVAFLAQAAGVAAADVGLYGLERPLAPHLAAALEEVVIDPARIRARFAELAATHGAVIVEGVGGALVPFCAGYDALDLAVALDLPALIVARSGLGTLNHTMLTVATCRDRGVVVVGIVVSRFPDDPDEATAANPAALADLTGVPVVGVLPEIAGLDVDAVAFGELDAHLDAIDLAALLPPTRDYSAALAADATHVWHPFTAMREYLGELPHPLMIVSGQGCRLTDSDGRSYIDGVSSLWVTVHGHRVRELDDALKSQVGRIAHSTLLGLANEPSALLAQRLAALSPEGLTRVFYSDSGSTAAEVALKIAFQYWRQIGHPEKTGFISFTNAYHGDTIGAVSVGGIDLFHGIFGPLLFDARLVAAATCYRCPVGESWPGCALRCLDGLEQALVEQADRTAAVILEPKVQGAAGILVQPPGYIKRVEELCRRHGVLLIADEVATGFGRTGPLFACELEDVRPDLMAVAKGITGGYLPLAATLATETIYEAFLGAYEDSRTFFHGHTYTGNPLACATALASLDLIESSGLLARAAATGRQLGEWLAPLAANPHVGEIRQAGMIVGIELVADKATRTAFDPGERVGRRVILKARENGVIIRPLGDVIVLMPPLAIGPADLRELVDVTTRAIAEVTTS